MSNEQVHLQFPARHEFLQVLGNAITAFLGGTESLAQQAYNIQLAVHEACANSIDHAYGEQQTGDILIMMEIDRKNGRFCATLTDQGTRYQPQQDPLQNDPVWQSIDGSGHHKLIAVPEPSFDQLRGRGLFLMFQLMDKITYCNDGQANQWQLIKYFETEQ